ncbi:MAG TPA: glycosyltransferase [Xanthomonadales bacterium]|nr:glycosyltransferase [Xanthomonadales bacterium]
MKPAISVVLPVRNGRRWLRQAVDSVLSQTLGSLELIVVDDHSDDGGSRGLEGLDRRLRVLPSAGRGVSRAFNTGLGQARGDFIARMDADDIALPHRLETQLRYLREHDDIDICGGCVEIFVDDGPDGRKPAGGNRRYQAWLNGCCSPDAIRRELFIESPIPNPTALFRREALNRLGGYGEPDWPEDYDLFLRADRAGMRMGKPPGILLRWREHGQRLTRTQPRYAPKQFQAAKAHHLARGRLSERAPVVIWGAGPSGRLMHDLLREEGVGVSGFLDVHPRRPGGSKRGLPVWAIEQLSPLDRRFILVAVGAAGARDEIRAFLAGQGRCEGVDYLCVA